MRLNAGDNVNNNNNNNEQMEKCDRRNAPGASRRNRSNWAPARQVGASVSTIDLKALPTPSPTSCYCLREWCYRLTSAAGGLLDDRLVAQMTWSGLAQLLRAEHVTLWLEVALKHSGGETNYDDDRFGWSRKEASSAGAAMGFLRSAFSSTSIN